MIEDRIITTAHYKDMGPWMKAVLENLMKLKDKIYDRGIVKKPVSNMFC